MSANEKGRRGRGSVLVMVGALVTVMAMIVSKWPGDVEPKTQTLTENSKLNPGLVGLTIKSLNEDLPIQGMVITQTHMGVVGEELVPQDVQTSVVSNYDTYLIIEEDELGTSGLPASIEGIVQAL